MVEKDILTSVSYKDFLASFEETLNHVFYERDKIDEFSQRRGFPSLVFREIMAQKPLSVAIPSMYGGRGAKVKECLGLLAAASYQSLPLSLTFGINIALFIEPLAKYGHESIKQGVFDRFLYQQNLGGLMITEPDFGSDALNMQTYNVKEGSKYHINGIKHWQGLTGMADYWIMTTRAKSESGRLGRDLDFFICDEQNPEQRIVVEEIFNNIGLYGIPYGRNKVDIRVPEENKLIPESTGLKLMMDLLHRSRLQFPGMGMGFLKRMMDEAIDHCTTRYVSGKPLLELDKVRHHITKIQSAFTICSAMCSRSSEFSSIENNLANDAMEANCMKAYITDLMQESSHALIQLSGANGYKAENFGARGMVDSRPFQIFEGSNDMLYTQIAEMALKIMSRQKISTLYDYLKEEELTEHSADRFKAEMNFTPDTNLSQRRLVDLGKIISRIIAANHVICIGNKGFRFDLINGSLTTIGHEVSTLLGSFNAQTDCYLIPEYQDGSDWLMVS